MISRAAVAVEVVDGSAEVGFSSLPSGDLGFSDTLSYSVILSSDVSLIIERTYATYSAAVVAVAAAPVLVAVRATVDAVISSAAAVTLLVVKEQLPKELMMILPTAHPLQAKQMLCPNSTFLD